MTDDADRDRHLRAVDDVELPVGACLTCGHVHTADNRCHPYRANNCPLCGTAATIGG